jgi:hypothetical protein
MADVHPAGEGTLMAEYLKLPADGDPNAEPVFECHRMWSVADHTKPGGRRNLPVIFKVLEKFDDFISHSPKPGEVATTPFQKIWNGRLKHYIDDPKLTPEQMIEFVVNQLEK